MKKIKKLASWFFTLCLLLPVKVLAADPLIPVGEVVGLELRDNQVMVAAFDDALGIPAKQAGLREGDVIASVDGRQIDSAEDVQSALKESEGMVNLEISRGGKMKRLNLTPLKTSEGPRLGVYLRQGISGIGTVTWYNPRTGKFGTLGHGVSSGSGKILDMTSGKIYPASVASVKKGEPGKPGQLRGNLTGKAMLGELEVNSPQGVFGKSMRGWLGEPIPVAEKSQIHTGKAIIRSTVSGDRPKEYTVEILKIHPETGDHCRNLVLKVTDSELLNSTGGIVQGMSGSPIIQDGRLIGAVTHVLISDPAMGYGILAENMLEAAA